VHFAFDKKQHVPAARQLAEEQEFGLLWMNTANYPMASDAALAQAASGKEPEVGCRKVYETGVLVVNVDTVLQVARAVRDQTPVTDRLVTVTGGGRTAVLRAPVGTELSTLVAAAGIEGEPGKVVFGGPMRGFAHYTLDFPFHKGLGAVTLLGPDEIVPAVNGPCINCGLCAMACPVKLVPGMLSRLCEYGRWHQAEEASVFSCVECGCCAYVCPAGRSMVQFFVHAKNELLAMRRSIG
jgi:electron transport complex protein RnfC